MAGWLYRWGRWPLGLVFTVACVAVAAYAFAYLYGSYSPRDPLATRFAVSGLAVPAHFFGAGLALLLAPVQLWGWLRRRAPRLHRLAGWLYAAAVLIGGSAGLALAPKAHGGWASGAGFALLAPIWLLSTGLGIAYAVRGELERHRRWMWRSIALTFAAVSLRLILGIGLGVLHLRFLPVYIFAAWACWGVNLAICELLLRVQVWRRSRVPAQPSFAVAG